MMSTPALKCTSVSHLASVSLEILLWGAIVLITKAVSLPLRSSVICKYSFKTVTTHNLQSGAYAVNTSWSICLPGRDCLTKSPTENYTFEYVKCILRISSNNTVWPLWADSNEITSPDFCLKLKK